MLIGLTGGIGSGKSAISRGLRALGYQVIDTDLLAREMMQNDQSVISGLNELFGCDVFSVDGTLNRQLIASQVFTHPDLLERLNRLVHPAVIRRVSEMAQAHPDETILVESAILFESGLNRLCDAVIAVSAPVELRVRRAMQRDHAPEEKIKQRMENQLTDGQREQQSDLIIINGENAKISDLCLQVNEFLCNFAGSKSL